VNWKVKTRAELCEIEIGSTPSRDIPQYWNGNYVWVSISDLSSIDTIEITQSKERITQLGVQNSSSYLVEPGTLLLSFKLSLGKRAFAAVPLYTNEAIAALPIKDKNELDPLFLYYALGAIDWNNFSQRAVKGGTLNKKILEVIEIAYPCLIEQRRIASILAGVDGERRRRRYIQSAQSDRFAQDLFVQMFGDPASNPMGWETAKLTKLGKLDRGRSKHRPRNDPQLLGGKHPLIQTGDIANASRYITEYHQTYSEIGLRQSKMWPAGTLCITIAANIAKTAILTFDSCFPDSVVGFTPYRPSDSEYVLQWFTFVQSHLEAIAPESAQKNINLEILRDLTIPIPPENLRDDFALRIEEYLAAQLKQREAARQTDHLFQTLLDRAFRGEL